MKSNIKLFIITIILIVNINFCKAQLMQTVNDADKIQGNKNFYIGKPFRILLNDIQPSIISYIIRPDSSYTKIGGVSLIFLSTAEYMRKNSNAYKASERPTTISVYFDDVNAANQIIKNRRGIWTTGLSDSLSNLVIKRVYAYGNGIEATPPRWIVVSCVYKKVMVEGSYQWRYEVTKKLCHNGKPGEETQVSYSTSKVDVESCGSSEMDIE